MENGIALTEICSAVSVNANNRQLLSISMDKQSPYCFFGNDVSCQDPTSWNSLFSTFWLPDKKNNRCPEPVPPLFVFACFGMRETLHVRHVSWRAPVGRCIMQ